MESVEYLQKLLHPDEPSRTGKKKASPNDVADTGRSGGPTDSFARNELARTLKNDPWR